jgi:hypothetical protein
MAGFPQFGVTRLEDVAVGTSQTTIPHGLSKAATAGGVSIWAIIPKSNATVWQSAAPDATNIYLRASSAATVDVIVGPA